MGNYINITYPKTVYRLTSSLHSLRQQKLLLQPLLPDSRHTANVLLVGADNLVVDDSLGAVTAVPVEKSPAGLEEDLHVVTDSAVVQCPVQRGDLNS